MKVIAFPADRAGCGWYRVRWPAGELARQGFDVEIRESIRPGDQIESSVDVVVIQRPLRMVVVRLVEWLQSHGVAVVIEIDDSFNPLPKGHPLEHTVANYPTEEGETRVALEQCCQIADLVTVTTPALARLYGSHGRVEIIPNMIPRERILAGAEYRAACLADAGRPTTVGYSGPSHFHKWDLPVVGKGVAQALHHTGARFLGIGNNDLPGWFRIPTESALRTLHWCDMHDYGPSGFVANQARFDVALAPLLACNFNDCKSDLKLLELAALGIPTVASPTEQYLAAARAVPNGIRIAREPYTWRESIVELIANPPDPEPLIAWAWDRVLESNVHRWWTAWEKARGNR